MDFPEYLMPILGFFLFLYNPLITWSFGWRLSLIIGVVGFSLGMFVDRAFRGSY